MTSSKTTEREQPRAGAGADDDAAERQTCVDCHTVAPPTETKYTLISPRHGWRLTRRVDASGRTTMEWRCPNCFARYRDGRALKR